MTELDTPTYPEGLPGELHGNPRRQAVPSIRGTVYQAWCSIDAWLQLSNADQVIYLEGAEDFDVVNADGAIAIQVRHTEASISLGIAKVREALEQFWTLTVKQPERQIDYHYLTTSSVRIERDADFGGLSGLNAWRAARTSTEMSNAVASYLRTHLPEHSILRQFLASATPTEMQERLFSRFHWLTDQPGIEAVKRSVDDRIRVLLHQQKRSSGLVPKVRMQLESWFWQVVVRKQSSERFLTFAGLLEQVDDATTTYFPVPVDQIPDLLGVAQPGLGLLRILRDKVPQPPSPLIQRPELIRRIEAAVKQRRSVLLTGTVFKGKTTAAQLVASTLCPNAWWINLTGRQADQVDNLLLALAGQIDSGTCPALVIIDDLDISPLAHRTFRDSLAMVLHRARASGRAVLISAQGSTTDVTQLSQWDGVEIIDVPELQANEVEQLCAREGCPEADAAFWGATVCTLSAGHPKLVQVRVAELIEKGWKQPTASYIFSPSSAADAARQIARRLLNESSTPEIVEFLYTASECTVLLHRSVAIRLAESVGGIRNPGDILEHLSGKWLDCVEHDWFRATPILRGAARETWSPARWAVAHIRLHDSILCRGTLSPGEAAALLFHAFLGQEPQRLATAALKLRTLENDGAREAVERNLLWLPYVALETGKRIIDDDMACTAFRALQFSVAVTLGSDTLPEICTRWEEEISQVSHVLLLQGMQLLMWSSIAIADSSKVPLKMRLEAIQGLSSLKLTGEIAAAAAEGRASFLSNSNAGQEGFPTTGTQVQILLALCVRWVHDASTLRELVDWLDSSATDELRRDFDTTLDWPLVQTSGAFVLSAWVTAHEEVTDWTPWLELFDLVSDYAKRRASPNLGREAAKAKAIVLTEYLSRADEALQVLDAAEQEFGGSPVLGEQRVNVQFQINDDAKVLEFWGRLVAESQLVQDPFAYRRAAISAARLGQWVQSEEIFRDAAALAGTLADGWTRFGLLVDCALVAALGGNPRRAVEVLAQAIMSLPASASDEGDGQGEALQRAASEVCRYIENVLWNPSEAKPKFQPGYSSNPTIRIAKSTAGQGLRSVLLRNHVAKLAACLGVGAPLTETLAVAGLASPYPYAQWLAAEARLAASFANGAGAEFIRCFVQFVAATTTIQNLGMRAMEEHSASVISELGDASQWLGLLVAGMCCAGPSLSDHLEQWLDECGGTFTAPDGLDALIQQLKTGAHEETRHLLWSLAANDSNATGTRCGAAAKLILQPLRPNELLQIQGLLTSATVSDASTTCQELFNLHLARRFALQWMPILQNPFQLPTPRTTVPAITAAIADVTSGCGTLRNLLKSISQALGQPLGEFMSRVR